MKPKLTYSPGDGGEVATIGPFTIGIYQTMKSVGWRAVINGLLLPGKPVHATPDAAKLAAERACLELAKVVVEILGK